MNRKTGLGVTFYFMLILACFLGFYLYYQSARKPVEEYTMSDFKEALAEDNVDSVIIKQNSEVPTGVVSVSFRLGAAKEFYVSDVNYVTNEVLKNYPKVKVHIQDVTRPGLLATLLPYIIVGIICIVIISIVGSQAGGGAGGGGRVMSFGKSKARMTNGEDIETDFSKVAGLEEEKEEVSEIVDFLKDPTKFVFLKVLSWWVLREQVRLFLPRLLQERRRFHFSAFPVRTSLRCLSV